MRPSAHGGGAMMNVGAKATGTAPKPAARCRSSWSSRTHRSAPNSVVVGVAPCCALRSSSSTSSTSARLAATFTPTRALRNKTTPTAPTLSRSICDGRRRRREGGGDEREGGQRRRQSFFVLRASPSNNDDDETPSSSSSSTSTSSTSSTTTTPPQPPQPYEYHDSFTDVLFIALCRLSYGKLAGFQSQKGWSDGEETYKGMVEVSRALMQKIPTASQQSAAVIAGFPRVAPWFRRLFPYSARGAELNAKITPAFFGWLVGPAEVKKEPIVDFRGEQARSVVRIERCRYLAESQCVGMCVNLCRTPVQTFFGEELGVPLRITPNFEDFSCEFEFGREALKAGEMDEVLRAPCLKECSSAAIGCGGGGEGRCPKLEG